MEVFSKAIKKSNIATLGTIISNENVDINQRDENGTTAFLTAAQYADCATLKWLVANGADIQIEYKTRNALYYVIFAHEGVPEYRAEKLTYLLSLGFTFDHPSFALICLENWEAIKNALRLDANFLNQQDRWGNNVLHYAAAWGHKVDLPWLIENTSPLSVDAKDDLTGMTPLHRACGKGHFSLAKYLVEHAGAKVNETSKRDALTPLFMAVERDHLNIVKWLVESASANIYHVTQEGLTLLAYATWRGYLDIVSYFIEGGKAKANEKNKNNWNALHIAAFNGDLDILKYLISIKDINVNEITKEGFTPLHLAIKKGHLAIVQWLVENTQAAIKLQVKHVSLTPLQLAILAGQLDIVVWLYEYYVKDDLKEDVIYLHYGLLHLAAVKGRLSIMQFLIENKKMDITKKNSGGVNILHVAAINGQFAIVQWLIETAKANINEKDNKEWTALHLAAFAGHLAVVEYLLQAGAELTERTQKGDTALLLASRRGHLTLVKWLLTHGASLEERDNNQETALSQAVGAGQLAVVRWLVEEGGAKHLISVTNSYQYSPFIIAASCGHLVIAQYLAAHNASLTGKGNNGFTALLFATDRGHLPVIEWLIQQGICLDDCDEFGNTALLLAAKRGHLAVVRWLVEEGGAKHLISIPNGHKNTPLILAACLGHLPIVQYLASQGASLLDKNKTGLTPLLYAAANGHLSVVEWLVQQGVSLDAADENSNTALLLAAEQGHLPMLQWLLSHGASLSEQNYSYNTILHFAVKGGHVSMVKWIVEAEGRYLIHKMNCNDDTPLLCATKAGHLELVQYLVLQGALLTGSNTRQESVLYCAVESGNLALVRWLLEEKGCKYLLDVPNRYLDQTPLWCAARAGRFEIVQYLVSHGASLKTFNHAKETVLFSAAKVGHLALVRWLIEENGCLEFINIPNIAKDTPLLAAASAGHLEVVQYLASQGALLKSRNDLKETVLLCAAKAGQVNLVSWLLKEAGCQEILEESDAYGMTPLFTAAKAGHLAIVQHLISYGASLVLVHMQSYYRNVLVYAAEAGHLAVLQWLVEEGGCKEFIETSSSYHDTPLFLAANKGHLPVVQYLISRGASSTFTSTCNESLLLAATNGHHLTVLRWLIEAGGCKSMLDRPDRFNNTPLLCAAKEGYSDITEYLINQGACLTNTDENGNSVVFYVAHHGDVKLLKLLSQKGILLSECRNRSGSSPLAWAIASNRLEATKYLFEQGCSIDELTCDEDYQENISLLGLAIKNQHSSERYYKDDEIEQTALVDFLLEKTLATTSSIKLDLRKVDLTPLQWEKFIPLLKNHPIIKEINLDDIAQTFQPALLSYICELVNENRTLNVLMLNGNDWIDNEAIAQLAEVLANNTVLKQLNLLNCQLTDKGMELLFNKLVSNQTLIELQLKTDADSYYYNSNELSDSLLVRVKALLERNRKKSQTESMASWTNLLRNVKENDEVIDSNLPRARTDVASLQGYCTFFARKLGITTHYHSQHEWEAFHNNQRIELSQILIEAIATGKHEEINVSLIA